MVRIRLMRPGKRVKKKHHFRIVVIDQRKARDGRFIEEVGFYNPSYEPMLLKINQERIDYWLGKGAKPSETVASLIKRYKKSNKAYPEASG